MTDQEFELGIDWATQFVEPTYAGIALLVGDPRGYEVLDYVIAYRDREDDGPFQQMVLEEVWRAAAERAWPQEAMALATSAAYRGDFEVSLDVLTEASNDADVAIVAESMSLKANLLFVLQRFDEANSTLDELTKRLSDDHTPAIRGRLIAALLNKGLSLDQLDRHDEEIEVYNEIVQRFGADERPEIREQVAIALLNKGLTLGQLDRPEDAIEVYDEIVQRFGADERPGIREQVVAALRNKGFGLDQLNRHDEEIKVYNEIIQRFGAGLRAGTQPHHSATGHVAACIEHSDDRVYPPEESTSAESESIFHVRPYVEGQGTLPLWVGPLQCLADDQHIWIGAPRSLLPGKGLFGLSPSCGDIAENGQMRVSKREADLPRPLDREPLEDLPIHREPDPDATDDRRKQEHVQLAFLCPSSPSDAARPAERPNSSPPLRSRAR